MKNPTKSFAQTCPYLNYWIKEWGFITIGNNYDFPYGGFLKVIDQGGVCFETENEGTIDDMFQKAENYLREVESKRFDKETREALEVEYRELGL